jgi:histidine triad (HIT) family protein
MAYDDNNIFARILRGELPSHRVYEDDQTVAFMDVMPQATGHALVLPKAPSRNLLAAAGQSVYHLHVHIIPCFDGVPLKPHTGEMEKPEVLAANAEKLRAALQR